MKCKFCEYEWTPKKESPVACPRCKNRFDFDRPRRVVGLQIGGTVGPEDSVGMHVQIPITAGVGVSIKLNNDEFDETLRAVSEKIDDTEPKAEQLKKCVAEALQEKSPESKLKKIHMVVMIGAGITKIAKEISQITKLLGF
ncbi:MAG: hypothetical protein HY564_01495 [Candidatus Jacksonbacteria bacterium]|nr:hypothetical protein [Candidatus Jacksonbacteria bacterium]